MVVSASRDKKVFVWELSADPDVPSNVGYARKALSGHSEPVACVVYLSPTGSGPRQELEYLFEKMNMISQFVRSFLSRCKAMQGSLLP